MHASIDRFFASFQKIHFPSVQLILPVGCIYESTFYVLILFTFKQDFYESANNEARLKDRKIKLPIRQIN